MTAAAPLLKLKKNGSGAMRIAAALEREIFNGGFRPDSPLPSTRDLAAHFGGSQRMVLSALDILERKGLLSRQERRRVHVRAHNAAAGASEILFFAFGDRIGLDSIYQAVNEFILTRGAELKYDYFSRIVSSSNALAPGALDRELARLANVGFVDCAVVYARFLCEEELEKFARLPYPVILLGELPDSGVLPEGMRLLSPRSWELPVTALRYAEAEKYRAMFFFYQEEESRLKYERRAMEVLQSAAQRSPVRCRFIPIPGSGLAETERFFNRRAPEIAAEAEPGTLIVTHNIHSEKFEDRSLLPEEKFPGTALLTLSIPQTAGKIKCVRRNFANLQEALKKELEQIRIPVHPFRQTVFDYEYRVLEEDTIYKEKKEE